MSWISINARMPEAGVDVIVTNGELSWVDRASIREVFGFSRLEFRCCICDSCQCDSSMGPVTHWMELPSFPLTDKQNEYFLNRLDSLESQIESLGLHNKEVKQDVLE